MPAPITEKTHLMFAYCPNRACNAQITLSRTELRKSKTYEVWCPKCGHRETFPVTSELRDSLLQVTLGNGTRVDTREIVEARPEPSSQTIVLTFRDGEILRVTTDNFAGDVQVLIDCGVDMKQNP